MLEIREPLCLSCIRPMAVLPHYLEEKIRFNYQLLSARIDAKQLLYWMMAEPEETETERGTMRILVETAGETGAKIKLELINQLVNRLLFCETGDCTYQDRIFISSILNQLGISKVEQFVEQLGIVCRQSRYQRELIKDYQKLMKGHRQLTKADQQLIQVDQYNEPKLLPTAEQKRKAEWLQTLSKPETLTNQNELYLHQHIYDRLQTGAIYNWLQQAHRNRQYCFYQVSREEMLLFEQSRIAQVFQYHHLKNIAFQEKQPILYRYFNAFEMQRPEHETATDGAKVEKNLVSRLAAAALFHLTSAVYQVRQKHYSGLGKHYLDLKNTLYDGIYNTLFRFEESHRQQSGITYFIREIAKQQEQVQGQGQHVCQQEIDTCRQLPECTGHQEEKEGLKREILAQKNTEDPVFQKRGQQEKRQLAGWVTGNWQGLQIKSEQKAVGEPEQKHIENSEQHEMDKPSQKIETRLEQKLRKILKAGPVQDEAQNAVLEAEPGKVQQLEWRPEPRIKEKARAGKKAKSEQSLKDKAEQQEIVQHKIHSAEQHKLVQRNQEQYKLVRHRTDSVEQHKLEQHNLEQHNLEQHKLVQHIISKTAQHRMARVVQHEIGNMKQGVQDRPEQRAMVTSVQGPQLSLTYPKEQMLKGDQAVREEDGRGQGQGLRNQLEEVSRTNQKRREMLQKLEDAATAEKPGRIDRKRAQKDLIRALEKPEQVLLEYSNTTSSVEQQVHSYEERLKKIVEPATWITLQKLQEYSRNPNKVVQEGSVIPHPDQLFYADLVQQEQDIAQNERLNLIYRTSPHTAQGEPVEKVRDNVITGKGYDKDILPKKVQEQVSRQMGKETERLHRELQRGISRQLSTISEQVYERLEKKIQYESRRRGLR